MLSSRELHKRRSLRNRAKLRKTGAVKRPRLSIHRSSKQIYAQIIDDVAGRTLVSAASNEKDLKSALKTGADRAAAAAVGKLVAERAVEAGVTEVVFDRGGFRFHGRVKALADAAREAGLQF